MCMYMYILITSLMQCGIISLLSPRLVRLSFLLRYSSALHTPTSFNNPQNNLYKRNLLLAFAGCGPHDPLRKSGGSCTMHGEHRHSWQWLSPCNTGALDEFLYPLGLSSPVLSVIEGDRCNYNSDCAMPGVRDCSHLSLSLLRPAGVASFFTQCIFTLQPGFFSSKNDAVLCFNCSETASE